MSSTAAIQRHVCEIDGLRVEYRSAGTGDDCLIMLHQSPSYSVMFESLMSNLIDGGFRGRLLAPDLPGFGGSQALPGGFDIPDVAAWLMRLIHEVVQGSPRVFAHHMGTSIAVQLEHDFPGTIKSLVLSGPALLDDELQRELPTRARPIEPRADGGHLLSHWQRFTGKDPEAPPALLQREMLSALASAETFEQSYKAVAAHNFAGKLSAVKCPTLVFAGGADPLRAAVRATTELLPEGVSVSLEGSERTYICERQTDTVATLLTEFFNDH